MTAAFFLMLREGLEAALIVGIIAAYLVKLGRQDALPKIWAGVFAALGISIAAGVIVAQTVGNLPLGVRASIEGIAAFSAVVVLTWMLFWMRRQGRAMKGELEAGVDAALVGGSAIALASLAFVAVVREGLETVLFLFAIGASSGDVVSLLLASLAGLGVAVALGYGIFALGIRIDLRRFFTVTGIVLIFVSAGLVSYGIKEFTEVGLLPATPIVFDLGGVLPVSGPLGSLLAGMFGYTPAPTVLQVIGYLGYLIPVLFLFIVGPRKPRAITAATATLVIAAVLVVAACGGSATASEAPAASADTTLSFTATEYQFDPSATTVPAGTIAFTVENKGTQEHEFELFKGDQVVDEIEGLVPGMSRTMTVDLAAGDYTYVCKLAGHDVAGMKGTLTVTGS